MRTLIALVVLAVSLVGCGAVQRLEEWTTPFCLVDSSHPVRALAVCLPGADRPPRTADTVAFLAAEILEAKYGHDVRHPDWLRAFVDRECEAGDSGASYGPSCADIRDECGRALFDSGIDVVLHGSYRHGGNGYALWGFNPTDSKIALGSITAGGSVHSVRGRVLRGAPLAEHAEVLAESVHWMLTHPGETRGSPGRLPRDQPWTRLSPNEEADRRFWY